jgi:hypothetical protein
VLVLNDPPVWCAVAGCRWQSATGPVIFPATAASPAGAFTRPFSAQPEPCCHCNHPTCPYAYRVGGSNGDGAWRGLVTIVDLIDPRPYIFQPAVYGRLIYTVIYISHRLLTKANPNPRLPPQPHLRSLYRVITSGRIVDEWKPLFADHRDRRVHAVRSVGPEPRRTKARLGDAGYARAGRRWYARASLGAGHAFLVLDQEPLTMQTPTVQCTARWALHRVRGGERWREMTLPRV